MKRLGTIYMKNMLYLFIAMALSCNNQLEKSNTTNAAKRGNSIQKSENSKYHTKQDSLLIVTEHGDSLKYSKAAFNKIVDTHSEFFLEYTENPDQLYFSYGDKKAFSSEAGKDEYYMLYAYFLKQRNGIDTYAQQRKKLIDIYTNLNSFFEIIQYTGTYFGHQVSRILGYAEFSVYLLPKHTDEIMKTYDISKQKEFYIKSLRQLIKDESSIDGEPAGERKTKRTLELNKIVDTLEVLITDNFYLRRAQEFQYAHYEYY